MKIWKDIYELPFGFGSDWERKLGRVCDAKGQFAFQILQYLRILNSDLKLLAMLNSDESTEDLSDISSLKMFRTGYDKSEQKVTIPNLEIDLILIRGWGNLTGIGGHNLSAKEASNVQDTLGEYIVEKLNKSKE